MPPRAEDPFTLDDAIGLALTTDPALASSAWSVREREAATAQAALPPNPELTIEVENFAGSGVASGFDGSETTVWLAQPIELGGKRARRRELASRRHETARWQYESTRYAVIAATKRRFVATLAAQQRLALAEETVGLVEEILATVSRRVKAGRVSSAEASKAEVGLAEARIDRDRAGRDLDIARLRLAASWGRTDAAFPRVAGRLEPLAPLPSLATLAAALEANPELARWDGELAEHEARLALRRAEAIPDVTISAGYRRLEADGDDALVFSSSLPLPLFDRNQGAVAEAGYALAAAEQDRRQAMLALRTALAAAHRTAAVALDDARTLETVNLPAARKAFAVINEGYRDGRFSYLEVLDAQRTLFATRVALIDTLAEYGAACADLERLVAAPLDSFTTATTQGRPKP